MRVDWRVRGLGLMLVLAAVPALLLVREPLGGMLAFASAVTGAFLAVVVAERAVPAPGAEALLDGGADGLAEVARGLQLQGRPVYVHDQGNVGEERLFLPASVNDKPVPILDADTVTYAGTGNTKLGVALPPVGLRLVQAHEAESGDDLREAPVPEVEAFLKGLVATHDLARSLRITQEEGGLRARFAAAAVKPPCFQEPVDPRCEASGCALCQAVGCALARGLDRPIAVTSADVDPPWVTLHLRPETPPGQAPGERQPEAPTEEDQA